MPTDPTTITTQAQLDSLVRRYNTLPAGPAKRQAYRDMLRGSTTLAEVKGVLRDQDRPLPVLQDLMDQVLGG